MMKKRFRIFNAPLPKPATKAGDWFTIRNAAGEGPVEILIYDQIGKDWWTGDGIEAAAFAAELKKIPAEREILLRVNSPGGSVRDGIAIYNLLAERRNKVVGQVDGQAASIASVILLAGREVRMPENALLMIHDPWGGCVGSAKEMRKAAEVLDKHRDAIALAYQKKTGASAETVKAWMESETWFTAQEAKASRFADVITQDGDAAAMACAGFAQFKKLPATVQARISAESGASSASTEAQPNLSSASSEEPAADDSGNKLSGAAAGQTTKGNQNMNRAKIIAMLKKFGIKVEDNATDEALLAQLDEALAKRSENGNGAGADGEQADEPDADEPRAEIAPGKGKGKKPKRQEEPADTKTDLADAKALRADINAINERYQGERKQRITAAVQQCVNEDRIPQAQADKWVERALKDEAIMDDLRAMPPKPPGAEPAGPEIVGEAPADVAKGMTKERKALESFMRGEDIPAKDISLGATRTAHIIAQHRKKLDVILAANTIDTALKRTVILSDLLRAFERRLLMIGVFAHKFENVPLQGTNKVAVPFYDLDTTASTDFVAANGYEFAEDTIVGAREVTINKRKYKSMNFSSDTFRRQPYFNADISMTLKAEQLALDVWLDILSIVKVDPYGNSVVNREPGTFDSDDMSALMGIADTADWPELGRAAVLSTDHKVALGQDDFLKSALHSGSTDTLRKGAIGPLYGFETFFSPRIPTNSEDLSGFICLPQAALVATAPILPAPGVRQQLLAYEVVVNPATGIAFEYRYGSDVWKDKDREVVECNYGYAKGIATALKRITSGASDQSSSSSASSVNSSSSSSSSASF
jgi:ATP-dependent Clp endopeptidase proteolytic subunit ClpP